MNNAERYIQAAGGLRQFWELNAKREAEERNRQEKRRAEQKRIERELAA